MRFFHRLLLMTWINILYGEVIRILMLVLIISATNRVIVPDIKKVLPIILKLDFRLLFMRMIAIINKIISISPK